MDEEPEIPDEVLVARTQAGNSDAFDELVLRHSRWLYGVVYNMTSNHEDTNALLQNAFANAYGLIEEFQPVANFSLWLHSIVVDMTLDFLTKRGRRT